MDKKKVHNYLFVIAFICSMTGMYSGKAYAQESGNKTDLKVEINGSRRFQQIHGFGVNANTDSWNDGELKPALDMLIDKMNASLWRVMVEMESGGEDVNDNDDPFNMNWDYYSKLYEIPKFTKAWNTIEYLNKRGIVDGLMINFMGRIPEWMGKSVIKPEYEDEFVEMQVSFLMYAKNVKKLKFGLFAPVNETDIRNEGPTVNAQQLARVMRKLADRMEFNNLRDIKLVIPDVASMRAGIRAYIPEMMKDPVIMNQLAHWALHSYAGYYANVDSFFRNSKYPGSTWWLTEWNAWRNGLDAGQTTEYNYKFASECVNHLLQLLKNGASAGIVWEGYDAIYQHPPGGWSLWGVLGYDKNSKMYLPRKHMYAIAQVSKYVLPGSWRIGATNPGKDIELLAFHDPVSGRVTITGLNRSSGTVHIEGSFRNLPSVHELELIYTDSIHDFVSSAEVTVSGSDFKALIPGNCIYTITGIAGLSVKAGIKPEPPGWYAGDMHVHRNCGDDNVVPDDDLPGMMETHDLAVISMLADMGNAEVKDSEMDLPKVNGNDSPLSEPGRIIHWDAEWHWDATYSQFSNQALGGHIVLLGLKEAHQIWDESPYKILEWGKAQGAVSGFCHIQYLNDKIQNELNCCIPIDYPVEAALGAIDFLAEDVWQNDAAIHAYYKLLNCGFRLGWAAGTDFPCTPVKSMGYILTYVDLKDKPLTYQNWIEGIKNGRTVVSLNGHNEFLDMKVNGKFTPGDEVKLAGKGTVTVRVDWTTAKEITGKIELVSNGKVVTKKEGTASPGKPLTLEASVDYPASGWICARRMDEKGHQSHTAPVYVSVKDKPVRASEEDAMFFVNWIDNILDNIKPGGPWNRYFTVNSDVAKDRYAKAKKIYAKIAKQARANQKRLG